MAKTLRACALLLMSLLVCPLAAQERPTRGVALNWVRLPGAEACVPPVELAARVERRLGRSVFVRTSDAIIVIEGRVAAAASGGFEMVLAVSDPDGRAYGSRELQVPGNDCSKLSELAALIVSITIRHEGGSAGIDLPQEVEAQLAQLFADEPALLDPSELSTSPPPVSSAPPAVAVPLPAAGAAPAPRAWFVRVEAGAHLATGLQPSASLGPFLRLAAAREGWGSAAVSGTFGAAQRERAAAEPSGELRYQPWQIALSLCWQAARSSRLELALCADAALGRAAVAASGFEDNRSASKLIAELGPSAGVRAQVWGPGYLQVRLGAPVRIARPAFQYLSSSGESRPAFSVAPVGVALELGVGLEL